MQKLRIFLNIIDATSEWTGKIASFAILLIIGIMVWNALGRYVFSTAPAWDYTTASKIFSIYIVLGAAYTLRNRAHVNVDILHKRFSLRVRGIIDVVTATLFFLFCITLLWLAVDRASADATRVNFSLSLLWPPNWPASLVLPIGIFLLLLQGLAKFVRDLIIAITGKELA